MNIKCDICGGELVMLAGGKGAACKVCGMEHSIERIREMLGATEPVQEAAPKEEKKVEVKPKAPAAPKKNSSSAGKSAKAVVVAADEEFGSVMAGDGVYAEEDAAEFVQVVGEVEPDEVEAKEEVPLTESSLSDFVTKKKFAALEIKAYNGHAQRVIFPSAGPYGSLEARETLLAGHDEIVEIIFPSNFSPSDDGSIFRGLKNLKRVIFHKGTMASDEAFKDCKALEEVSLGDEKLVMLGTSYFSGCKKLKKVSIDTDAELSIFGSAFKNCSSLKEFVWANREVAELDFGDRVCSSTFEGCTSLKRVVLGDHIKAIHKDAFKNCTSLESVTTHSGDLSGIAIHPDAFKGASFQPENVGICPQCGRKLICRKDPGNEYNTMICPESKCGFSNGEYD